MLSLFQIDEQRFTQIFLHSLASLPTVVGKEFFAIASLPTVVGKEFFVMARLPTVVGKRLFAAQNC